MKWTPEFHSSDFTLHHSHGVFDDGFFEAHSIDALRKVFVVTLVEGRPGSFQDVDDSTVNGRVFN